MIVPEKNVKAFIDEKSLLLDSFRLGCQVHISGFSPDFIVGIWRGGSAVGIVVQECLQYFGVQADHIAIRTSYQGMRSYPEMISNAEQIQVHGLDYLRDRLAYHHNLLLVDDVFSSGYSLQAVKTKLRRKLRKNMPEDVRVAAVWYRPVPNRPAPDYFVNQTNCWLVLPYELTGLSLAEIQKYKAWAAPIVESVLQSENPKANKPLN